MTTHVDRDAFKVREYVRRGRVIIRWCPGDENWSDIFTKPLANPKFTYFCHCACPARREDRFEYRIRTRVFLLTISCVEVGEWKGTGCVRLLTGFL
jgi:hypothetical protein